MSSPTTSVLGDHPRSRWTGGSHKRSGGRLRRGLSTLLILAGGLLLADVVATLVWQEPVTALVGL
ncbi:MAG: hypothetical protein ACRDLV_16315, partial [Solirubrobacteraceae bacterium]